MASFADLKNSLQRRLRAYLPRFLSVTNADIDKALLSQSEINDLRNRIYSQQARTKSHYDTASQQSGDVRSLHRGYGWDYEESRLYQAGDESRYMNWPLSARTGQLYMKVFREERRASVFIVLDRRRGMCFGTRTRLKVAQAARVAACVALDAHMHHASIAAVILNVGASTPHWLKEACGEQATDELISVACSACPPELPDYNRSADEKGIEFGDVLNMLQVTLMRGTSLYLISDFEDLQLSHRAKLMQLAADHKVAAIHIVDPAEQQLSQLGQAQFQISVVDRPLTIDTDDISIQSAFSALTQKHFAARKQIFTSLNITYTQLVSSTDSIESVLR